MQDTRDRLSLTAPTLCSLDEVQEWGVESVFSEIDSGSQSGILYFATGTGKTYLTVQVIRRALVRWSSPVLFVVNRKKLVDQSVAEFRKAGLVVEIEQGQDFRAHRSLGAMAAFRPDVIVASKDSLHRRRITNYPPDSFHLIITDECHWSDTPSFLHIYDYFKHEYHLGLSATPWPAFPVYEKVVAKYSIREAIANGHLAQVEGWTLPIGVDLTGLRAGRDGNFDPVALESRILDHLMPLTNAAVQEIEDLKLRKVMAFYPEVRSAKLGADAFNSLDIPGLKAVAVYGDSPNNRMPQAVQDALFREYEEPGTRVILCSCKLVTTGYNYPPTDGIIHFDPTKSLVDFVQKVGRGTRNSLSTGKTKCHVIGFSWEGQEGLLSSVDLFFEDNEDPRVRERARKIERERGRIDPQDAINEAKEQVEEEIRLEEEEKERIRQVQVETARREQEARAKRNAIKQQRMEYKKQHFTPYGVAKQLGVDLDGPTFGTLSPATTSQRSFLASRGMDGEGITREDAETLIRKIYVRDALGLASEAQVAWMIRCGLRGEEAARRMSRAEATELQRSIFRRKRSGH